MVEGDSELPSGGCEDADEGGDSDAAGDGEQAGKEDEDGEGAGTTARCKQPGRSERGLFNFSRAGEICCIHICGYKMKAG